MAVEGSGPVFPQSDYEQIVDFGIDSTKSITVCGRTERRSRSLNVDEVSGEYETLRKSGSWKDGDRRLLNSVNKSNAHLKKPSQHPAQRRGTSPLAWFPREKAASFLERKIKHLQESGGMNSTLDEFLGDSNPHYPKVEREKRAARSAANKAMEARKAAMVEASWCRILKAARINSKEAEEQLATTQMYAEEAFQEASAMGIVMYDRAGSPRRPFMIKTSPSSKGGGSTHTVTASFETAFEVDKEVAAAVKQAIIHLHTQTHSSENNSTVVDEDVVQNINDQDIEGEGDESLMNDSFVNVSGDESDMLIDTMFQRLVLLNGDELESLSNIVATCGLNAILEDEESKQNRRENVNLDYFGSLESCFPKHLSELEKEVNEAKNNKNIVVGNSKSSSKTKSDRNEALPDLGSFLKKHKTRLEKEVEAAKFAAAQNPQVDSSNEHLDKENMGTTNQATGIGGGHSNSLESVLVKHVHRLEKEKSSLSLEKISTTCTRKVPFANQNGETESLDKVLVKHVSRLEREKMAHRATTIEEIDRGFRNKKREKEERNDSGLGDILVKHVPRLQREKMQQLQLPGNTTISSSSSSSELRERRSKEMEEAWGGVSLGNSSRPHLSRIQREKAAWSQAEEEERKRSLSQSLEV